LEGEDLVGIVTHNTILAGLPHSEDGAKSLKDIAQVIGLAVYTHIDWIRAERSLARVLWILVKNGVKYLVTEDRAIMVIDSGTMFTGRQSWQSSSSLPENN